MTTMDHTPVPKSGRGAVLGWSIVVVLMIVGMVVAFFTLDAGKVYVTPQVQSYVEYETTLPVAGWYRADGPEAKEFINSGATIKAEQTISTPEENAMLLKEAAPGEYPAHGEVERLLKSEKTVDVVRLTGDVTVTQWQPKGDPPPTNALDVPMTPAGPESTWTIYNGLPYNMPAAERPADAELSVSRTVGVWLAALLTLAIMSFLAGDNPFYKTAESILVGASAGYAMAYAFYTGIVDQLLINLFPALVRDWTSPGLPWDYTWNWVYIIPGVLSVMLVCRLLPKGGWIARWPLAFIIGATAGFRLTSHLESDFLLQIKGTITTLWAENANGQFDVWNSVGAVVILFGVLLCLVYFFFSLEHKGAVGKAARGGIFVLMITFGAAFGLTVMGRITLLTERFDFLFKEWLHLL